MTKVITQTMSWESLIDLLQSWKNSDEKTNELIEKTIGLCQTLKIWGMVAPMEATMNPGSKVITLAIRDGENTYITINSGDRCVKFTHYEAGKKIYGT